MLDDPPGAARLVRTALEAGDRDRAERVLAQAEHLAAINASFPAVVAASRHARGLVDADPALVQQEGADHRNVGAKASAWEDAGVILLGTDDRAAARDLGISSRVALARLQFERDRSTAAKDYASD